MLHIVVHTPCAHVYELAAHLGCAIEPGRIRLPVQDRALQLELYAPIQGSAPVASFEVRLADGTIALRGQGRVGSATLPRRVVDLDLTGYHLEGPGAPLFWELERQTRRDRGSRPSIPAIWDDETVPRPGSSKAADVLDQSDTVVLDLGLITPTTARVGRSVAGLSASLAMSSAASERLDETH